MNNIYMQFPGGSVGKDPPARQETWARSLGLEDPLEEGMATHSSILAWRIPMDEEPGGLQPMGSQKVRHDMGSQRVLSWLSTHTWTVH